MTERAYFTCYDRRSGTLVHEPVYASALMSWACNTLLGSLTTELLLRQRPISRIYGWLNKLAWSRRRIKAFAERYRVNWKESLRQADEFTSFNDFFTREIDLSHRPIQHDSDICVAANDGRVLAYPVVDAEMRFGIKGRSFNLRRFLCEESIAQRFVGGSMVISRFYLHDYHWVHFPDCGVPHAAHAINGKQYALGPYDGRIPIPFFSENFRMRTLFDSDHFGQIAMVEIGAFTVGSIQQRYRPGVRVAKGERKGFFELGGSTVVLLFQKGAIHLDPDLCARTRDGIETYVRLGDSIGRR